MYLLMPNKNSLETAKIEHTHASKVETIGMMQINQQQQWVISDLQPSIDYAKHRAS